MASRTDRAGKNGRKPGHSRPPGPPPNPFARHHLRRYAFCWEQLAGRQGRHLDLGCGRGEFLAGLQATAPLECAGADPHAGYVAAARLACPGVPVHHIPVDGALCFADGEFDSVSLLDVLEHAPDEGRLLAEVWRVLAPGGIIVVTVPRRHAFSFLDPDNAKFRFPRFHRLMYVSRFGRNVYKERFEDLSNGLRGDISVSRKEHTNYRRPELFALLRGHGFQPVTVGGANLFWRWLQIPALVTAGRVRALLERAIYLDGVTFTSANAFVTARRLP
jgi:SAM-dependent methyltransferase